ncbi:hypothetical protein [Solitalea canadensis]|uniref:YrhC-like protein n=1 Tax=Solitalea canadensis (strain ATCC 29591 / DSM 3403 / JCM 21819 / LMG 8368 / NBRC 15130 / NCIMB 12057 / USAM 9D) TaxID=929556 RepID=H8KME8_SOLCM|nr:hypothetical protein [Solitalea canadensis]AFD08743.1 hypothetical protein Solca_3743 [Solitalea canadensis DSM 3403]
MEQKSENNFKQKSPKERFLLILGVAFIAAYFVLGAMVIFMPTVLAGLPKDRKLILGCALILYGAFRCYRLVKKNSEYE